MFQMYNATLYVPVDPTEKPRLPWAGGTPKLLLAQ